MPSAVSRFARIAAIAVLASATVFASIGDADARRAGGFGGFGSRGTRTFNAPPITQTAPAPAAPIERSMTPRPQTTAPYGTQQPGYAQQRPGFFNGFGRSMIGGLIAGGLLGMLLGHGFGGGFGFLGMLLQIALIFGAITLAMRFFANRRQPSYGTGGQSYGGPQAHNMTPANAGSSFRIPAIGSGSGSQQRNARPSDEIGLAQADLDQFEELLTKVQTAYGAEDYAALRRLTTPEAMSYLAEELGENATNGVRNQVSDVKLLQGDIAEAWRENGQEYATLAMRYSSIDAMVERSSGRVVSGDDRRPSESTEVWTFVRKPGADWKLAAIQGTGQRAA
jgi:predicted lipid-binding transport protein (Tim44 family)